MFGNATSLLALSCLNRVEVIGKPAKVFGVLGYQRPGGPLMLKPMLPHYQ